MQDAAVALRRYLLDDQAVSQETDGNIFVEDIPQSVIDDMPRNCIVIQAFGGIEQNHYGYYSVPRYDIWSYGSTRYEAAKVDGVMWDALHELSRVTKEDTLLHSVVLSGGPRSEKEPDTGWPVMIRSVTVRYATKSTV